MMHRPIKMNLNMIAGLFFIFILFLPLIAGAAPQSINFQGKLTDTGGFAVTDPALSMTFRVYDAETGGTLLWEEHQTVNVYEGIYTIILGSGSTTVGAFDTALFSSDNRWLEIVVDADVLAPRQSVNSVAYAMKSDDSNTLDGMDSVDLDQSAHASDTNNPHGVTASQIGAATISDISWSNLSGIPADIADGDDAGITLESDPTVPSEIKDGINWTEISNRPSGLDDGDDLGITSESDPTVPSSIKDGISWEEVTGKPEVIVTPYVGTIEATNLEATDNLECADDLIVGDNATVHDGLTVGGTTGGDGDIYLNDGDGNETVHIDSDDGDGGSIIVKHMDSHTLVNVDENSDGGNISIWNASSYCTIQLMGDYGGTGNGRINVNGNEVNDYAEYFDLTESEHILPGMVVIIDPDNKGQLKVSTHEYDKKVAGIISGAGQTMPGMVIGDSNEGNEDKPLAVSGRVYCYVDATERPVEVGDLLTTSSTPGHAIKAFDFKRSQGAIVGKAMESLDGEKGLILVLVTLQ